ncbi:hypothetical protein OROGR_019079 [Orobanche gracilis]
MMNMEMNGSSFFKRVMIKRIPVFQSRLTFFSDAPSPSKIWVVEMTWRDGENKGSLDPTVYTGVMGTTLTRLRSYEATGDHRDLQLCSVIVDACASAAHISNS